MAKYKVGDKVKVGGHTATIVKILGTSASGEQMYGVKQDDNGWAYESLEGKMKAANASSKFQPGTKVFVRMYPYNKNDSRGAIGVIKKNRGNTMDVEIDGKTIEVDYRFLTPSPNAATADVVNRNTTIKSSNPVVANALMARNDARKDINDFIKFYGEGGMSADAIREEYRILVGPYEKNPELSDLVSRAKKAMARGIRHAFVPTVEGTYKGLRFQGGGIQMPDGEPVDIEVYAGSKFLGLYNDRVNPGRTPEEKIAIKEYVKKIGVGSRYIHNSATSKNAVATNADRNPESLANWKRILPKLKEFNNLAGWLKGEGAKLMNVARNFDDKKFHSIGYDIQSVCEWSERKSAEILKQA